MIRTLIVDDEELARKRLRRMLEPFDDLEIVGEAENGADAVTKIESERPDLIFLDVQMPDLDGFGALKMIELERMPMVIFVTAFDQFAVNAFEVNAIDYLLKPIRAERLLAALNKTRGGPQVSRAALDAAANQPRRHLSVHERGKIILVPLDDILYLRAELKYVTVRTAQREFLVEESLTHLEEEFGEAFVRRWEAYRARRAGERGAQ